MLLSIAFRLPYERQELNLPKMQTHINDLAIQTLLSSERPSGFRL